MKVRFTPRAARDLAEIADYRDRNPAAAQRVRDAILESLRNLASFPTLVEDKMSSMCGSSLFADTDT
jgi:toxin ParE1/3/4